MATTLVGIFDDYAQAQNAVRQLTQMGIKQGDITIARNHPAGEGYTSYGGANSKDYDTGTSMSGGIADFFNNLFGGDSDDPAARDVYAESVRRGSTVVTVNVEENLAERAADAMNEAGAVDVDRRSAQYRATGYKNFDRNAKPYTAEQIENERREFAGQQEMTLPVIEEQLAVGKKIVQRGGVRVHTRVTERPVEETVTLREEKVNVERRPVSREVTDADLANLKEGEFTVTTEAEEAVVGKQARVVEEVVVGKEVIEREETVRETVKRTDVDVDEVDGVNASRTK